MAKFCPHSCWMPPYTRAVSYQERVMMEWDGILITMSGIRLSPNVSTTFLKLKMTKSFFGVVILMSLSPEGGLWVKNVFS